MLSNKRPLGAALMSVALAAAGAAQAQSPSYWRADIGFSMSANANIQDKDQADLIITGDPTSTTSGSLKDVGNGFLVNGGYGKQFGPTVRGDVTLGYRAYKLDTSDGSGTKFKSDITSLALMANAYYENDRASGVWKPYVGLGLGVAQNKFGDFTAENGSGTTASGPGGTKTGFAWAFMFGFGIPQSKNLTWDIGYRYVDLGKIETASGNLSDGAGNLIPISGLTGNLRAHELFVGARF